MTSPDKLAALLFELQDRLEKLENASQAGNTTVGGAAAIPLADVVAESAVTNAAFPGLQDDVADSNAGVSDLQAQVSAVMEDLDARLDVAYADLDDARSDLEQSQEDIRDAFGQSIEGLSDRIDQIVVGEGGVLLLFSDEAPTADDKAPAGSTWWMVNAAKNIVGQWQQTGSDDAPEWTPRPIESDVIANLDVGKLTAGQAAIAQVVAQKIAASTANIQTVNVGNLFVTDGATMNQATIDYLFANVVTAKKITTDMLDVNSFNGVTITGAIFKSAATGARIEMQGTRLDVYGPASTFAATIRGQTITGSDGSTQTQMVFYVPASGSNPYGQLSVGNALPWYRNSTSLWKTPWTPNCDVSVFNNAGFISGSVGARQFYLTDADAQIRNVVIDGSEPRHVTAYLAELKMFDPLTMGGRASAGSSAGVAWADLPTPTLAKMTAAGAIALDTNGGTVAAATVTAASFRTPDGTSIVEDTDWITVPAASIGPNYTVRAGYPVKYRRKNGIVFVIGQLYSKAGASAGGQGDLLTFPAGFRPPGPGDWFAPGVLAWSHYNQVTAAGVLSIFSNTVRTSSTGYPLDGLQFIAS